MAPGVMEMRRVGGAKEGERMAKWRQLLATTTSGAVVDATRRCRVVMEVEERGSDELIVPRADRVERLRDEGNSLAIAR